MSNSSIWPKDRTLLVVTPPSQSGPGRDGNEGVLSILHSSSNTEASPSDCLVSYLGYSFGGGVLPHCTDAVGVFYIPNLLDSQNTIKMYRTIYWESQKFSGILVIDLLYFSSYNKSGRTFKVEAIVLKSLKPTFC